MIPGIWCAAHDTGYPAPGNYGTIEEVKSIGGN